MKKLLRKLSFILVMILVFTAITACSSSFSKYLPVKGRETPALNDKVNVALGENEEICPLNNDLNKAALHDGKMLIIKNTVNDTYYLYNLEKQSPVGNKDYTDLSYFSNGIFLAAKGAEKKYGLLNVNGDELLKDGFIYQPNEFVKSADGNVIRVSYKYFKIENDKTLKEIGDSRSFGFGIDSDEEEKLRLYGDFLYAYDGVDISKGVSALNAYSIKGVSIKKFEDESASTKYFILNGGNILIKKDLIMPFDAKEYTYLDSLGNKYQVKYEVFNLNNGSIKTAKFDYYIEEVKCYDNLSQGNREYLSSDVLKLNRVTAYEIKEKRLVKTDFYKKSLFVNNSLDVKSDVGLYEIYKLSDNRFLFVALSDKLDSCIRDKKGNVIIILGANYEIHSSYTNIEPAHSGEMIILYYKITGKYGAISKDGETIADFVYDSLSLFYNGKAFATIGVVNYIISSDKNVTEISNIYTRPNGDIFYVTNSNDVFSPNGTMLFNATENYQGITPYRMFDGTYFFVITLKNNNGFIYYYVK